MKTNSKQGLEPLLCNEPKILILGSLPGDISIESQEYYANNKNFFWRIIATITGSPVPLSYPAKKEMLAQVILPSGMFTPRQNVRAAATGISEAESSMT